MNAAEYRAHIEAEADALGPLSDDQIARLAGLFSVPALPSERHGGRRKGRHGG